MGKNIFFEGEKRLTLEDYMNYNINDRGNLGDEIPVAVYRLMEYSLKEELNERFGKEEQVKIFRKAGYRAGAYFAAHMMDMEQDLNGFTAQLQNQTEKMKIGVLRIESFDTESGRMLLTVSEDVDCSGLPMLGEAVCNYDEGFIAGILSTYLGRPYTAVEIDCWATGDRVCRFEVKPEES